MSEWRPIETAPKDGSTILVWNGQLVFDVWWWEEDGAWVDGATDAYDDYTQYTGLTHWQPLPAPPEDVTQHAGEPPEALATEPKSNLKEQP